MSAAFDQLEKEVLLPCKNLEYFSPFEQYLKTYPTTEEHLFNVASPRQTFQLSESKEVAQARVYLPNQQIGLQHMCNICIAAYADDMYFIYDADY